VEPKPSDYYLSRTVKPWFWKQCNICEDEMKKEPVHKISIAWNEKRCGPDNLCVVRSNNRETDIYYFCNNCCNTLKDAEKYFEEKLFPLYIR
jgi:hypothetical protein